MTILTPLKHTHTNAQNASRIIQYKRFFHTNAYYTIFIHTTRLCTLLLFSPTFKPRFKHIRILTLLTQHLLSFFSHTNQIQAYTHTHTSAYMLVTYFFYSLSLFLIFSYTLMRLMLYMHPFMCAG